MSAASFAVTAMAPPLTGHREVMGGLVLIEAHGAVAMRLHLGVLLHLRHVLFVRHACRHRGVLRERR
ncbi:MAG: hypothetical protein U0Q11_18930 [Vicinamibacterales bacterium]